MSEINKNYTPEAIAARAEILDRIHLYCHAWDRQQWDLYAEVFHEDGTCNLSSIRGPWRQWVELGKKIWASALLVTHHQVGNSLIGFDGDAAYAETYVTAFHRVKADAPPGDIVGGTGREYEVLVGARYLDRFERQHGKWLIFNRRTASEWRRVREVNDGTLAKVAADFRGAMGDADPSAAVIRHWL